MKNTMNKIKYFSLQMACSWPLFLSFASTFGQWPEADCIELGSFWTELESDTDVAVISQTNKELSHTFVNSYVLNWAKSQNINILAKFLSCPKYWGKEIQSTLFNTSVYDNDDGISEAAIIIAMLMFIGRLGSSNLFSSS